MRDLFLSLGKLENLQMAKKPTYEELEQKVKELEKEEEGQGGTTFMCLKNT